MKKVISFLLGVMLAVGEIIAKVPADADTCYVRVGQNLIWWVCPVGINGAVDIWD